MSMSNSLLIFLLLLLPLLLLLLTKNLKSKFANRFPTLITFHLSIINYPLRTIINYPLSLISCPISSINYHFIFSLIIYPLSSIYYHFLYWLWPTLKFWIPPYFHDMWYFWEVGINRVREGQKSTSRGVPWFFWGRGLTLEVMVEQHILSRNGGT